MFEPQLPEHGNSPRGGLTRERQDARLDDIRFLRSQGLDYHEVAAKLGLKYNSLIKWLWHMNGSKL